MTRAFFYIPATLFVALVASAAQGDFDRFSIDGVTVEYLPDGAVVRFDKPIRLDRIEVLKDVNDRTLIACETYPERPVSRCRLFYPHRQGRMGAIWVFPREGQSLFLGGGGFASPDPNRVGFSLEVPYRGEADAACRWSAQREPSLSLIPPSAEFKAAITVYLPSPLHAILRLQLPKSVAVVGATSGWDRRGSGNEEILEREIRMEAPGEILRFSPTLRIADPSAKVLTVRAVLDSPPFYLTDPGEEHIFHDESDVMIPITQTAVLRIVSTEKMAEEVRAESVLMPTDARGNLDVRRPRDTVVLPSRALGGMRRMLGFSEEYLDYYAPFAHEAIAFENKGAERVPLAVSMRVVGADDNAPVAGFRAPDYLVGPEGTYATTAELAPGAKTTVVLPVYARPDVLLPGRYRTVVEARILGTDTLVARVEHPIEVRSPDVRALAVTAAALLVSLAGLAFFLAMSARIFRRFRVSELVLTALFATMTFALAVVPGSLLGPIFSAVAGPFAFLFQGLFFEVVRVLVLVTLVVLVPKPGVVTLVSIVRYLLGGLAFGGFSPVDLVYLGSSVVLTEGALYLGGVTSRRGLLSRPKIGIGTALYVALLVGLANAAVQYATYSLNISLYRLYFADWFILLAVIVDGFLYAALGAVPGVKLGARLKRISE